MVAEAEPGAVGQRGRRLWVAGRAGSGRPGWQAVSWQIRAAAQLLVLPMAGGDRRSQA